MRKTVHFADWRGEGWPSVDDLEPYFLAPPRQRWFFETGNDAAILQVMGVDGTEHLEQGKGRIDVDLEMWGHRDFVCYSSIPNGVADTKKTTVQKVT